jgi:hypothetical protein
MLKPLKKSKKKWYRCEEKKEEKRSKKRRVLSLDSISCLRPRTIVSGESMVKRSKRRRGVRREGFYPWIVSPVSGLELLCTMRAR